MGTSIVHCRECGADLGAKAAFCQKCGTRVQGEHVRGDDVVSKNLNARRDRPEEELWQGVYSSKAMLGHWVFAGLVTIAGIVLSVMQSAYWMYFIGGVAVVWLFVGATYWLRRLDVRYRLTNQRFYHQHGILSRTTDRVEVIDMDDITCTQGPIERLLGVGTIKITSSDRTHPELYLRGLEGVEEVSRLMDQARRAERVRRGLHIESI